MTCSIRPRRSWTSGATNIFSKLHIVLLLCGGCLAGTSVAPLLAQADQKLEPETAPSLPATWQFDLTGGFDSYLHTYSLAVNDTTVTLAEYMLQAGWEGRSARNGRSSWLLRAEASAGTELFRERLQGEYRWLGAGRIERGRIEGRLWGRQYRQETEYSRSSDSWEGRLEGRVAPLVTPRARLEVRGWAGGMDYERPSSLEVKYRDLGSGLFVRSSGHGNTIWGAGARAARRDYPDSTAIDRQTWSLEGDLDHHDLYGRGLRAFHRSERRSVRDQGARPSAWTHWTDLSVAVAAGPGRLLTDWRAEIWQYDQATEVYVNSVRLEGFVGYGWGDVLTANWQLGLAGERLAAGSSPESYTQMGLRGGVSSYGNDVSGSLTLEYGRRIYGQDADQEPALSVDVVLWDASSLYSDFHYWQIWLTGTWHLTRRLDLDLMANYEPESHTERSDDAALGFASLRLRWRP